jgi:hypothetical protein
MQRAWAARNYRPVLYRQGNRLRHCREIGGLSLVLMAGIIKSLLDCILLAVTASYTDPQSFGARFSHLTANENVQFFFKIRYLKRYLLKNNACKL